MSFFSALDPTSDNFLGGGVVGNIGRGVTDFFSFGIPETFRTRPFGAAPKTLLAKAANVVGGGLQAGFGGFVSSGGNPLGAAVGFATGATLTATKTTSSTSLAGGGANFGAGVGSGLLTYIPSAVAKFSLPSFGSAAKAAASGPVGTGFFSSLGKGFTDLLPTAFLSTLLKQGTALLPAPIPGASGVSLNSAGPGTPGDAPSLGPNWYPGVPSGLQTVSPNSSPAAAPPAQPNYWLWIALAALVIVLVTKKKKHGH